MSIRKIRFFAGFTGRQAKWLNSMSAKGYRLTKTGKLTYDFDECDPDKYVYTVEYVGDRSFEECEEYKAFLESCGYRVFYKNINLDYSVYKVTYRPWADKGGRVSSTAKNSTFNKELMIVEKENDGKPFELHTETSDRIDYYRRLLRPWNFAAFIALLALILFWGAPIPAIISGCILFICLAVMLIAYLRIKKLKNKTEE